MNNRGSALTALAIMDSMGLIKSKSIRGPFGATMPAGGGKVDRAMAIIQSTIRLGYFPSINKKQKFTPIIVMSENCNANNWRLLKNTQKEKGMYDVICVLYSHPVTC